MFGINVVSRNNKYSDNFLFKKRYKDKILKIKVKIQIISIYHETIVGNRGVSTMCVNENHEHPVMIPTMEPTTTWFHVWYCKYVLLKHTRAVSHQHATRTKNRPARSNGNRVLLFMWWSLKSEIVTNQLIFIGSCIFFLNIFFKKVSILTV